MSRNQKVKILPSFFRSVPDGYRIRYKHHYVRHINLITFGKVIDLEALEQRFPPRLVCTEAWAVDANGNEVPGTRSVANVHPKDTAIKRLGRKKAHNRAVRALEIKLNKDHWYNLQGCTRLSYG
jgi:hypothetical protein